MLLTTLAVLSYNKIMIIEYTPLIQRLEPVHIGQQSGERPLSCAPAARAPRPRTANYCSPAYKYGKLHLAPNDLRELLRYKNVCLLAVSMNV